SESLPAELITLLTTFATSREQGSSWWVPQCRQLPALPASRLAVSGARLPRLLGRTPPRLAPKPCRRNLKLPFECPIEGGLRLVSDLGSDLGDRMTARCQHLCSQLKSPASEISHR